jgi:hypothetical protein
MSSMTSASDEADMRQQPDNNDGVVGIAIA